MDYPDSAPGHTVDLIGELAYLRWFKANINNGPVGPDVHEIMNEEYTAETGKAVPKRYA